MLCYCCLHFLLFANIDFNPLNVFVIVIFLTEKQINTHLLTKNLKDLHYIYQILHGTASNSIQRNIQRFFSKILYIKEKATF